MSTLQEFPLVTQSGRRGRVFRASRYLDRSEFNRVIMEDGTEEKIRAADLKPQPDGTFLLKDRPAGDDARAVPTSLEPVAPDAPPSTWPDDPRPPAPQQAAEPQPGPAAPPQPVRAGTTSRETLYVEDVSVDRTPVNRLLDGPVETRQEGDVTIIPVVEEVLTVQKRLLLKEEVRITRKRRPAGDGKKLVIGDEEGVFTADGRKLEI